MSSLRFLRLQSLFGYTKLYPESGVLLRFATIATPKQRRLVGFILIFHYEIRRRWVHSSSNLASCLISLPPPYSTRPTVHLPQPPLNDGHTPFLSINIYLCQFYFINWDHPCLTVLSFRTVKPHIDPAYNNVSFITPQPCYLELSTMYFNSTLHVSTRTTMLEYWPQQGGNMTRVRAH